MIKTHYQWLLPVWLMFASNLWAQTAKISLANTTVWNFDNKSQPLTSSYGPAELDFFDPKKNGWGQHQTGFGASIKFGLPIMPGGIPKIMAFPATNPDQGYKLTHHAKANGTHLRVDRVGNYTLIMDIYWPASSDKKFRALLQTQANNTDDADLFFNQQLSGGVGVNDFYHGEITAGKWHRIAIVVRAAVGLGGVGQIEKYLDGYFIGAHNTGGVTLPSRWALDREFLLFSDNDGEVAPGYLSSLLFADRGLTGDEIKRLAGPHAKGLQYAGRNKKPYLIKAQRKVDIVAHRGATCCSPENTLEAIEQAFAQGADHIEVDVRINQGIAYLMHDARLERTTNGTGPSMAADFSELQQLDAGSWFDARYKDARIPSLSQALTQAAGRGRLWLDVKAGGAGLAIAQALRKSGRNIDDIWIFWGGQEKGLATFAQYLPGVKILLGAPAIKLSAAHLARLKSQGLFGVDVPYNELTYEFIEKAHSKGLYVSTYTLFGREEMLRAIEMGVDGIETDYPGVLAELMP